MNNSLNNHHLINCCYLNHLLAKINDAYKENTSEEISWKHVIEQILETLREDKKLCEKCD